MALKTQEASTMQEEDGEGYGGTGVGEGRRDKDMESLTELENVLANTEVGDGRGTVVTMATVVAVAMGGETSPSQGR